MRLPARRSRIRSSALLLALGLAVIASCGTDEATEYGDENREAFLAACTDGGSDGLYEQRVCQCVYDEAEASIPFERFREVNDELADAEDPALPDELLDALAVCIIEEGDL